MSDIDSDEMGAGTTTFVFAFLGAGLLVLGFVLALFIWPVGLLMMGLGVLCLLGSPIIGALVWFGDRQAS